MPAPRQPIEIREFARPDLPLGGGTARTARSEVCGTDVHLWHGRLAGVPYPIIPGHVSAGILDSIRGPLRRHRRHARSPKAIAPVFFDVHRTCGRCRACTVHRTPTRCPARRVYGITDPASEGLFGGWSQAIYLEPGVGIARLPDAVSLRRLHRRRLRTADGGAHPRARGAAARRHGARPGRWRGRAERRRACAPRRRLAHLRDWRTRRAARAGASRWARTKSSISMRRPPIGGSTKCSADPRRRRGRRHRGRRLAARDRRRARSRP